MHVAVLSSLVNGQSVPAGIFAYINLYITYIQILICNFTLTELKEK